MSNRRFLSLCALAGASGSFALAALFWRRLILMSCSGNHPESSANCFQTFLPDVLPVCIVFAASALALAVLIFLPHPKSTDD